jgi:Cdc25 family phosphatase
LTNAKIKENRDKDKIVFHCSLSQQRGPKGIILVQLDKLTIAAKLYQESQRLQGESGKGPQVYVLEGGFVQWQREFGKDKEVTSKYDEEYWKGDHF